jgi:DNA-binding NarL/FixJ family response regulator
MPRLRIVLVDDHPAMLAKVRSELGDEFEILAAVNSGEEALQAVSALSPDVLITDISMSGLDGLEIAMKLRACNAQVKIIFLTIHEDPDFLNAAFQAGASGYVTKARLVRDLSEAVRQVSLGQKFISPG